MQLRGLHHGDTEDAEKTRYWFFPNWEGVRRGRVPQIGAFGVSRDPTWRQPVSSQNWPFFQSIHFFGSNVQNFGSPAPPRARPGDPLAIVHGGSYEDCDATVDGNVYIQNRFTDCVIETKERPPLYWRDNVCHGSYWTRPGHEATPLNEHCVPDGDPVGSSN